MLEEIVATDGKNSPYKNKLMKSNLHRMISIKKLNEEAKMYMN